MDVFALCLSQNSVFAGSLDKLVTARPSSVGYLDSVAELKAGDNFTNDILTVWTTAPKSSKVVAIQEKDISYPEQNVQKSYELPRMPPWFVYIGGQKLYQSLSGILRLVGLSLMAGHLNAWNLFINFVIFISKLLALYLCCAISLLFLARH